MTETTTMTETTIEQPAATEAAAATGEAAKTSDWRAEIVKTLAGDDTGQQGKLAKRFEKFADLPSMAKSLLHAEEMATRRGTFVPGKDASEDERAAYFRAIGVPEKPEAYKIEAKLPDGVSFDDGDKPFLDRVTKELHSRGGYAATPEAVRAAHETYAMLKEEAAAQALATEQRTKAETEAALKAQWPGAEYKVNIDFANAGAAHLTGLTGDDLKQFMSQRLADGSTLGVNRTIIEMFAKAGRALVDDPIFAAASVGGAAQDLEAEKASIMALRRSNPKEYARLAADGGRLDQVNAQLLARQSRR